jgi:arsenate reductase
VNPAATCLYSAHRFGQPRLMTTFTIYHNPRCSKSRQALALLNERGIEAEVIEYLKNPPTVEELRALEQKLKLSISQMVRTKEAEFSSLGLAGENVSDDTIRQAVAEHPILLERPIITRDDAAVIGRPPENLLDLL